MSMELRHLRYFLAVAEARSFTGAARRLHLAQPALSQQVRALENELGVTLIERGARTRGLTEAGARFARRARRILLEAEAATEEMAAHAGARTGRVRFGSALQSLAEGPLPPLLAEFHRRHPDVRVAFREAHTAPLLAQLAEGRLDLALIHLGRGDGATLRVDPGGAPLAIEPLYREPLVVVVGPGHRLAGRAVVRLAELAEEEFVSFGPGSTVRELVARAARRAGFQPRAAVSAVNLGTVRALVSAGLGVSVLPRTALALPGPPLRGLRLTAPALKRVVALAHNTIRYRSPATLRFGEFLCERLTRAARE
jgi:LysR family transcriptional regulator, transcription activator of glutamate synthase operon